MVYVWRYRAIHASILHCLKCGERRFKCEPVPHSEPLHIPVQVPPVGPYLAAYPQPCPQLQLVHPASR
jgi:hypothetical protein